MASSESLIAAEAGVAELTAEGGLPADKRGQWSWALYEAARDPNQVFQIFVISPFIATVMIRDPAHGQEVWGSLTAYSGVITAILCPFFGAIADRGGPRKPWLALFTLLMVLSFAGTWFGVADSTPLQIFIVGTAIVINNVVFEFSNAFHGAMLSRIAPPSRIGGLSGLSFALGTGSGFILMLLFLVFFILPGAPLQLPDHIPERLSGPITAAWMLVFAVPLFLFTPDRERSALPLSRVVREGIASVISTVRSLKRYSNVAHYIGARTLFNDGLTGVLLFSGIFAAGTFHLDTLPMTIYGLLIVFFGTIGGFFGGWLDDIWGLLDSVAADALAGPSTLTMAELRILRFLPTHHSFREIGLRLHVSTNTVKTQAHAVYRKLEVSSRSDAVARACEIGLLEA